MAGQTLTKKCLFFEGQFHKGLIEGAVRLFGFGDEENPIFTGTLNEGLLMGPGVLYYPSGKKFLQGVWLNDTMNGKRNFGFYESGARYFEGDFGKEGAISAVIYDRNGRTVQYRGSAHPLRYGTYKIDWGCGKSFDRSTGKPRCIGSWVLGKLHGENVEIYDSQGTLASIGHYTNGALYWCKEWNREGKLKSEACLFKNRWQGLVKKYGPHEELLEESNYENGIREGQCLEYWNTNNSFQSKPLVKKLEGFFYKGKIHGTDIKQYSKKGILIFNGSFAEGEKEGVGSSYHSNGVLESTGFYQAGVLNDHFVRVFSNEGFPVWEGRYMKGHRWGLGRAWDLRGKLRAAGWFEGAHMPLKGKPGFNRDQVGKLVEVMGKKVF